MGTRSTVKFYERFDDKPIACIYQQYDGYYSGVGKRLAEFLINTIVINGFGFEKMENGFANGMGCLAAQYIAKNKTTIGGFYMTTENDSQEYNYEVRMQSNKLVIKVDKFTWTPEQFLEFKDDQKDE